MPRVVPMDVAEYVQLVWITAPAETPQVEFFRKHWTNLRFPSDSTEWAYGGNRVTDFPEPIEIFLQASATGPDEEAKIAVEKMATLRASRSQARAVASGVSSLPKLSKTLVANEGNTALLKLVQKLQGLGLTNLKAVLAEVDHAFAASFEGCAGRAIMRMALCRHDEASLQWMANAVGAAELRRSDANVARLGYGVIEQLHDMLHKAFVCELGVVSTYLGATYADMIEHAEELEKMQIAIDLVWQSETANVVFRQTISIKASHPMQTVALLC